MHEAAMHSVSSFATLTYDEAHYRPDLCYVDFQRFMWSLRQVVGPCRFFVAGEYGDLNLRPHFHAVLFGHAFFDGPKCGDSLFQSRTLSKVWRHGFVAVGEVTRESAAYVSRYATKKVTGDVDRVSARYSRVDLRTGELVQVPPELARMSLRPGVGRPWFDKYWRDVYLARDGVPLPGGFVSSAPRAYDKWLESLDGFLLDDKKFERFEKAQRYVEDSSPARLLVEETCVKAKLKLKRRSL